MQNQFEVPEELSIFDPAKPADRETLRSCGLFFEKILLYKEAAAVSHLLIAEFGSDSATEERNLFSYNTKCVLNVLRNLHRQLYAELQRIVAEEKQVELKSEFDTFSVYLEQIVSEIRGTCTAMLAFLETEVLPRLEAALPGLSGDAFKDKAANKVFFMRMVADHHRYLCETEDDKGDSSARALQAYQEAVRFCEQHEAELGVVDPVVMSLFLNFSVFYNENLGESEKGLVLAKEKVRQAHAFLAANPAFVPDLDLKSVLQLMEQNIEQWELDLKNEK